MEKFWSLDLSDLDTLMADRYSAFDPPPGLPPNMLSSILLSVEFKVSSYTKRAISESGSFSFRNWFSVIKQLYNKKFQLKVSAISHFKLGFLRILFCCILMVGGIV